MKKNNINKKNDIKVILIKIIKNGKSLLNTIFDN